MRKQYCVRTGSAVENLEPRLVLAAGALDTSFGTGGTALAQFRSALLYQILDVAVQPNDYTVSVGVVGNMVSSTLPKVIGVARVRPDGASDPTFGVLGSARVDLGTNTVPRSVAIAPGNKTVIAGFISSATTGAQDVLIVRLNVDGSLDVSFDADGYKIIDLGQPNEEAGKVVVLADGRIVIAGTSGTASFVSRLNVDGTPDSTFAGTGLYAFDFGTNLPTVSDLDVDSAGRYLVTARNSSISGFALNLARISANGTPDSSFDGDGILVDRAGTANSVDAAIRADGRIVVTGSSGDLTLYQYNSNGTRDTTFGTGGAITIVDPTKMHVPGDVAIQSDGKLVVGSESISRVSDPLTLGSITRLNADGSLDSSFGVGGRREMLTTVTTVQLRSDGKIAAAVWDMALLTSTGQLDSTFGLNGYQSGSFGMPGTSGAYDMARLPDGKFVVAGSWRDGTTTRPGVMRLNSDGSIDATFGTGGQMLYPFGAPLPLSSRIEELIVDSDGKILVIGRGNGFSVARLHPNGALDTTFDGDGLWKFSHPSITATTMYGGAVQADGKIVLLTSGNIGWFAIRLNSNGSFDTSLSGTGIQFLYSGSAVGQARMAVDNAGRIVFSAYDGNWGVHLVRLTPAGNSDTTFNGTGSFVFPLQQYGGGSGPNMANHLVIQPDNRILVAVSTATTGSFNKESRLGRITEQGAIDPTFTQYVLPTYPTEWFGGVSVAADGSVLLTIEGSGYHQTRRLTASGSIHANYLSPYYTASASILAERTVVAPDGSLVVFGGYVLGVGSSSLYLKQNVAFTQPTAVPGGPYSVSEGATIPLNGAGSFEPSDTISSYEWDLNYDGVTFNVDATGATLSFSTASIDGPASRTIALRVTGSFSQTSTTTTTVNIANANPTATFTGGSAVNIGSPSSVAFSSPTDPSAADVAAGFKYSFDFNNDGDFTDPGDVLNSTSATAAFTYASAGTFNVRGRISDKDGGFTDYTTAVTVNPGTPSGSVTVNALADAYVRDGSYAGTNFGSAAVLDVKKDGTGAYREAYIKFDIAALTGITSAKLRLFGKLSDAVTGGINVSAYDVADNSWVESTIKYTGRPPSGALAATANIPSKTAQWIEWDLTSYLQAKKSAAASQVTLVLKALVGGALISFNSNNNSTNKPQLLVGTGTVVTPQNLIVSPTSINVPEASKTPFTVKLATAPTSDVIVTIARTSGDADLSPEQISLTFTSSNWNVAQNVYIIAASDADTANGSAMITISSTGLSSKTVTATEVDDDVPPSPDITLNALDDAHVRDGGNANTNYGASTLLEVKKDGIGNTRESYLKFDIASLGSITAARLRLFGRLSDVVSGGINVGVYDVSSNAWSEGTINYTSRPASGALVATKNMASTANGWIEWDLTTYLQNARTAGRTQVTLVIKAPIGGALISFSSRNAGSNQPQLLVSSGTVTPVQSIVVSTNSLSVNEGATNSFTVKLATAPASDVTVNLARSGDTDLSASVASLVFTPANWNTAQTVTLSAIEDADMTNGSATFTLSSTGLTSKTVNATEIDNDAPPSSTTTLTAQEDAHVRDGGSANTNYGSNTSLEVKKDGTGNYRESYLKFDLTSLTTITSAKLRLFGKLSDPVTGGINVSVYDVTGGWAEGTLNYASRPASSSTPITTTNLLGTTAKWYEWDLTAYLQAQKLAGKTSVSLVLRAQSGGALITFNSKNNASNQPQIVVN